MQPDSTSGNDQAFPDLLEVPEELRLQITANALALEQLRLSTPEERQAGEDAIMEEMSKWVPVGGSLENKQYINIEDNDDTSENMYEQLREKYLGADYQQSCSGYESEARMDDAEWRREMGLDEPFEPMMYRALGEFLSEPSDSMGTKWVHVLEPSGTRNGQPDPPACPVGQVIQPSCAGNQVVNLFDNDIYKADLIRCPDTAPSEDVDSLNFFSREYVRSLRLLKVKRRWYHLTITDWKKEVNTLIEAFSNSSNNLTPWEPLSSWFALYYVGMQGIPSNRRFRVKMALTKRLEEMAKLRMEESQAAVLELLMTRNMMTPKSTWSKVKKAVDEDCENRGSLLLGTIPEFTYQIAWSMSAKWSWVD